MSGPVFRIQDRSSDVDSLQDDRARNTMPSLRLARHPAKTSVLPNQDARGLDLEQTPSLLASLRHENMLRRVLPWCPDLEPTDERFAQCDRAMSKEQSELLSTSSVLLPSTSEQGSYALATPREVPDACTDPENFGE